ncbi:MAG: hypothetical protein IKQ44_04750 [Lachnospiraceae bacterium]|nr:hypothetical protein [Lachnospiraceae bacterium]
MNKNYNILVSLVVLVATVVCMFLFATRYNLVFWINLAFAIVAVLMASFVIVILTTQRKRFFGITLSAYAVTYLVIALFAAFKFVFMPDILAKKVALVHVIILAVFIVVIILAKGEEAFITEQQEIRATQIGNFKYTLTCMKNAMSKVAFDAPYKKTVEHAYDALASGQTASSPDVEEVEKSILEAINRLDGVLDAGNEDEITSACREIEKLANERKAKLAVKANF